MGCGGVGSQPLSAICSLWSLMTLVKKPAQKPCRGFFIKYKEKVYHTPDINNTFTRREEVQESVYVNRDQTNLWTNTKRGAAGEHRTVVSALLLLTPSPGCLQEDELSQEEARGAKSLGLVGYKHNTTRATH